MSAAASQTTNAILLVDDDIDLLTLFEVVLTRIGNPVFKVDSGRAALGLLENLTPAIIILDLAMPEMSGIELLILLRRNPRFDATKIVILTAVPVMLERQHLGMISMLLSKPITPRQLEQTVRNLLNQ